MIFESDLGREREKIVIAQGYIVLSAQYSVQFKTENSKI